MTVPGASDSRQRLSVKGGDRRELRVAVKALHLALGEFFEPCQVRLEAQSEKVVLEHRCERRGYAHAEREGDPVFCHPVEGVEQREVALDQRFVEPTLLEVALVLRVADEGEVRVEHERQISSRHTWPPTTESTSPHPPRPRLPRVKTLRVASAPRLRHRVREALRRRQLARIALYKQILLRILPRPVGPKGR